MPWEKGRCVPGMLIIVSAALALIPCACSRGDGNLLADPSFEITKSKDQFGLVFARWGGWKYEGDCEFRVGEVAHSGKHSCLLKGGIGAKIRMAQNVALEPGRYRVTAYLRGLDIGKGTYNSTTEFMFDGKYQQLNKNGTFGWTRLTYVGEIKEKKQAGPSFGLMAPGYFWIDDVALEKVGDDVPLTDAPVLGEEESPIAPPGDISQSPVRCPECGYRNNPAGKTCYACGTALASGTVAAAGPALKSIATFEDRSPFSGGTVVERTCLARAQGAASRPGLRQHGPAPELARLRFPQGRSVHRGEQASGSVRGDPRRGNEGLLDPGQLLHGRAPRQEHADHPAQTALRGREIEARADARPGKDHTPGLRDRRCAGGAPLSGQSPPRARRLARPRPLRGPSRLRLRDEHQPRDGGLHADHPVDPVQQGARLRTERRQNLARVRRPPARTPLPGLPLHRIGRPGGRPAPRQVPGVREHRQPVRILGRVPDAIASARFSPKAGRS